MCCFQTRQLYRGGVSSQLGCISSFTVTQYLKFTKIRNILLHSLMLFDQHVL